MVGSWVRLGGGSFLILVFICQYEGLVEEGLIELQLLCIKSYPFLLQY